MKIHLYVLCKVTNRPTDQIYSILDAQQSSQKISRQSKPFTTPLFICNRGRQTKRVTLFRETN